MNKEEEKKLMDDINSQINELIIDINELEKKDDKTQEYTYKLFIIYQKLFSLKFNYSGVNTFFNKQKDSYLKYRTDFDCIDYYAKFDDYFQKFCNYLGINQLAELNFEDTLFPVRNIDDYFKCIRNILFNLEEHIGRTEIIDCFSSIEKNIPIEKARELKQIFNDAKNVLTRELISIQEAKNIVDKLPYLLLPKANIQKGIIELNTIIENALKNLERAKKNKNRPDGQKIIFERAGYILYENKELEYKGKLKKINRTDVFDICNLIFDTPNGQIITRKDLENIHIISIKAQDAAICHTRKLFDKAILETKKGEGWIVNIR